MFALVLTTEPQWTVVACLHLINAPQNFHKRDTKKENLNNINILFGLCKLFIPY